MKIRGLKTLLAMAGSAILPALAQQAQQYVISTVAGGGAPPTGVRATDVALRSTVAVTADPVNRGAYFASSNAVFRLDQAGFMTLIAGDIRSGFAGDGGPAELARFQLDLFTLGSSMALDTAGNMLVADTGNHRIRRISPNGVIVTIAGGGVKRSGDGGPATDLALLYPAAVALDQAGNLYIADLGNNRVLRVGPDGIVKTFAGGGGSLGDGGPAASAQLFQPRGLAIDQAGNIFIADSMNFRVRKVSPAGIITTVAGTGARGYSADGDPATQTALDYPTRVAVDPQGTLYIADGERIRKIAGDETVVTVAGHPGGYISDDGGPATDAKLDPLDFTFDASGNLLIADGSRIRRVLPSGVITSIAGIASQVQSESGVPLGDGGPAVRANLYLPHGVAVDSAGNLFIADTLSHRVRKVSSGTITTVAGNGTRGFSGDGGPATLATLAYPASVAVDAAGNLLIADAENNRIRRVSSSGIISTVAGGGIGAGDGGPATRARLSSPSAVAAGRDGTWFIGDRTRILKVLPSGIVSTLTEFPPSDEELPSPFLAVDASGELYFTDLYRAYVRRISRDGTITIIAGNGALGFAGDGGLAVDASLAYPAGVTVDADGNIFVAEDDQEYPSYSRIRKISPDGIITTIAGNPQGGFFGDGDLATKAGLSSPGTLAADSSGNVYIADSGNNAIRALRPAKSPVFVFSVVDSASQRVADLAPGKIVVIYGDGLGPPELKVNQPVDGKFGPELAGTQVSINGLPAPVLYTSSTQVAAVVPYAVSSANGPIVVAYQGRTAEPFLARVRASAPSSFTLNQAGAGQAAAFLENNSVNNAANPVKAGATISLYATGGGQTLPAGEDGAVSGSSAPLSALPVSVTIDGIPAEVLYAGGVPGQVAGLMRVNVRIPPGVRPGGYVPVVLRVGDAATTPGAVWISVSLP